MSDPAFRKTVLYETPAEDARNPLRLCICRFALIEGGGYRIIRHRHPEYEFMIPLDGPYESVLNGKRLLVHPGQQILIQPGDIHEDLCDGSFRFAAFRFRFEGADGIARPVPVLRRELSPEERIVPLPPESFPARLLGLLLREPPEETMFRRMSLGHLAESFFWELLGTIPVEKLAEEFSAEFSRNTLLSRLERVFAAHVGENMTGGQIAACLGMSRRVLEYQLKRSGLPSPHRLFTGFRCREAIHLMRYEGLNVSQAAYRLGFATPYHFSRVFKSVTGRNPSEYCF